MFVYSFKASSVKMVAVVCLCVLVAAGIIALMPNAGYALNVNKFDSSKALSKINVKTSDGRLEYLSHLGYSVNAESEKVNTLILPEKLGSVELKYNNLQKSQGFDLSKYCGKELYGYSYTVSSFPDGKERNDAVYTATLICYKNKVVGADITSSDNGTVLPLVKMI